MFTESDGARVFDELVNALQQAEAGSRKLDILISYAIGETPTRHRPVIKILLEDDSKTDLICKLIGEDFPRYTASLDARLPDENVVLTMYSDTRRKWAAAHKPESGDEIVAWAATEALARRLAAIKARQPAATERSARPTAPRIVRPRPAASRADRPLAPRVPSDAATEDWDIRF